MPPWRTVLSKEIDAQTRKVETLRTALENAASSFGENDKRTQNWQVQLNNAEAALNGMEHELQQNNAALADAGTAWRTPVKPRINRLPEYVYLLSQNRAQIVEGDIKRLDALIDANKLTEERMVERLEQLSAPTDGAASPDVLADGTGAERDHLTVTDDGFNAIFKAGLAIHVKAPNKLRALGRVAAEPPVVEDSAG